LLLSTPLYLDWLGGILKIFLALWEILGAGMAVKILVDYGNRTF
jgi:hypothetical protein